ncbi:hypothetical protein ABZ783_33825 [Micromonospora sp. NPDC047738]|uniref:hypothetical protein n=1 Tax=Micromonospora sp. NPDC047738 TaxID=3155741 RepID=UPI0033E9CFB4
MPAPRVVERVTQPRVPTTVSQWETTLDALAGQLRAGRHAWDRHRIRDALNGVLRALGEDPLPVPWPISPPPPAHADPSPLAHGDPELGALDDAAAAAVAALIVTIGGDETDTTLTRLAARTGHPAPAIRDALAHLASHHLAVLHRHGQPVDDVAALAEHARFRLQLPTTDQAST